MSNDFFEDIKKVKSKSKRASFTIDEKVLSKFNKIAKINEYNKSKIVENFLKKFIESETKSLSMI